MDVRVLSIILQCYQFLVNIIVKVQLYFLNLVEKEQLINERTENITTPTVSLVVNCIS